MGMPQAHLLILPHRNHHPKMGRRAEIGGVVE